MSAEQVIATGIPAEVMREVLSVLEPERERKFACGEFVDAMESHLVRHRAGCVADAARAAADGLGAVCSESAPHRRRHLLGISGEGWGGEVA